MQRSESITNIATALLAAQKEFTSAVKDSKNPFFKNYYADLNSVIAAVKTALNKHGITVLQPTTPFNGKEYVETCLLHSSGETLTSLTEIVSKEPGNPQMHGSAISYARRYGLSSMLCVETADDDGNLATGNVLPAKTGHIKAVATTTAEVATTTVAQPPATANGFSSFRKPAAT